MKGSLNDGARGSFFRKFLVVGQFTITIALLICTIIAYEQLAFIKNRNLGFNKDYVIDIRAQSEFANKYEVFKGELLANSNILGVTASSDPVSRIRTSYVLDDWEGKTSPTPFDIRALYVDEDFCKTFDIELLEGRFFSRDFSDSSAYRVVINEYERPGGETV